MDDCLRAKLCQVLKNLTWNCYVYRNGKFWLLTPSEEREITEEEAVHRLRTQIIAYEALARIGKDFLIESGLGFFSTNEKTVNEKSKYGVIDFSRAIAKTSNEKSES